MEVFKRKPRPPRHWTNLFKSCVEETCRILDEEVLKPLGLKTLVIWDHPLTKQHPKWCAAYLRTEDRLKDGTVAFTFHLGRIYVQSVLIGKSRDRENVRMQAEVFTAHETAHGLIDYIRSLNIEHPLPNTRKVLGTRRFSKEEEELAEEFGRFFSEGYTRVTSSTLDEALKEITGKTSD